MRLIRFLPLLFLLAEACLDPLTVTIPLTKTSLVVDGLITDAPGPYQVKLFQSSPPDTTTLRKPKVESGASVWIIDDDSGDSELLAEIDTAKGTYITSPTGVHGQVGRHYSVRIVTAAGKEYHSLPQEMLPSGTIDSLYATFRPNALLLKGSQPADAFGVFVDSHGSPNEPNLFRWRWTGTYKGQTFPELRDTLITPPHPGNFSPNPEPCSGYIYAPPPDSGFSKVAECTCCFCWATENSKNAVVSDSRFASDYEFKQIEVAAILVDGFHFYERYLIEVEQLSLSKETYEFWKLVRAQQQSVGSLFQPSSVRVKGNITCVTNPDEEVLGIFSVSGSTKETLSIPRSAVPVYIPPIDTFPLNCMHGLIGDRSTNYKPDFW